MGFDIAGFPLFARSAVPGTADRIERMNGWPKRQDGASAVLFFRVKIFFPIAKKYFLFYAFIFQLLTSAFRAFRGNGVDGKR
jgi:hypothetical protein